MPTTSATFPAPDGTRLAYRVTGDGAPLVCLPGGPSAAAYLGDLGGLSAHRRLIALDLRGTGGSEVPADAASRRCDRMVDDVEALRAHLGLARIDLLAHSGGANLAVQYAARHPHRVGRLALIGPGTRAVGLETSARTRLEQALLRKDEPWFPAAFAALEAITEGRGSDWAAVAPFLWGRWDAAARRHHAAARPSEEAAALFAAEGAFTPEATRRALAAVEVPVLLLTGAYDLNSPPPTVARLAAQLPAATVTTAVQPDAGHYPWHDSPTAFTTTTAAFLAGTHPPG